MMRKLEQFAPPGYELKSELKYFLFFTTVYMIFSFSFFLHFHEAYELLFHFEEGVKILLPNALMPDFETLSRSALVSFRYNSAWILCAVWLRYRYFKTETKSVYVMLRLPKRTEYHMRCWVMPITLSLLSFLIMIMLKALYFTYYKNLVPLSAWPPGQSMNLWSVIL